MLMLLLRTDLLKLVLVHHLPRCVDLLLRLVRLNLLRLKFDACLGGKLHLALGWQVFKRDGFGRFVVWLLLLLSLGLCVCLCEVREQLYGIRKP